MDNAEELELTLPPTERTRSRDSILTVQRALVARYFLEECEGFCTEIIDRTGLNQSTVRNIVQRFYFDGILEREEVDERIGYPRVLYYVAMDPSEYKNSEHAVFKALEVYTKRFKINTERVPWTIGFDI
jgi:predicted transcriptional regulator